MGSSKFSPTLKLGKGPAWGAGEKHGPSGKMRRPSVQASVLSGLWGSGDAEAGVKILEDPDIVFPASVTLRSFEVKVGTL